VKFLAKVQEIISKVLGHHADTTIALLSLSKANGPVEWILPLGGVFICISKLF